MLKSEHYKRSIPWFALDKVVIGEFYGPAMQREIHRFKFVHNYVDRVHFQQILAHIQEEYPYTPDYVVYPPVSLRDRIFRGPNHARIFASYLGLPVPIICPFHKKLFSSHQSRRTKSERSQIRDEYSINPKISEALKGKKILLIDDLITTWWTAHTLGKLLKKAGATEVVGYFLASEKVEK